jgi:hypothetical protein
MVAQKRPRNKERKMKRQVDILIVIGIDGKPARIWPNLNPPDRIHLLPGEMLKKFTVTYDDAKRAKKAKAKK